MMNHLSKARLGFFFNIAMIFVAASCSSDKTPTSAEEPRENYTIIETFAGTGEAGRGADGLSPLQTKLYLPQDLTFSPDDTPYILDWNNHRVCIVDGDAVRTLIGTGELGDAPAGQALEIGLNHPTHVAFDPQGRLILSAWHNSKILRMDLTTGVIVPICGDGTRSFRGDGGPVEDAWVNLPSATAFDASGLMYISDQANQRIRVVDSNGIISTFAGNGTSGFSGDGGPATEAQLFSPVGQAAPPASRIAMDKNGNLYLADTANNRVRMIDTNGIIHTVAGDGEQGYSGDGGPATQASMNWPTDVALDSEGNLFIADTFNSCIRKVDKNGIITTFVGQCEEFGFEGDGGHPTKAKLARPYGIAFDSQDNLYIADTHNHRIRIIQK